MVDPTIQEESSVPQNQPHPRGAREPVLHLLLADEAGEPVLPEGLPGSALTGASDGAPDPLASAHWDAPHQEPNNLQLQRWAIVVREGARGRELAEAMKELAALREEEQGAKAEVLEVHPNESAESFVGRVKLGRGMPNRPRYLLLLGDAEELSFDFQQRLGSAGCFVGRLCFPTPEGDLSSYRAYAAKVCKWSERAATDAAPLLFYTAADTEHAREHLVDPARKRAAALVTGEELSVGRIEAVAYDPASAKTLLSAAAEAAGGVLFTASHGLGVGRSAADEGRRARQGALRVSKGVFLDGEAMRSALEKQPFLAGGLWFCFACFSAGTPRESAYAGWLSHLAESGATWADDLRRRVLSSLPDPGKEAFVAALPQAALASPNGPLGFVGHVDVGFSYAYTERGSSAPDKIFFALKAWADGSRAGTGFAVIERALVQAAMELNDQEELRRRARLLKEADPTDPIRRGNLWMAKNDLRAFILLGDPAARLPLRANALQGRSSAAVLAGGEEGERAPQAVAPAGSPGRREAGLGALSQEAAVKEVLQGEEAPVAIAARAGVPLDVLWTWVGAALRARDGSGSAPGKG
jgi:hypothetical protein